jgi:carbonic anhydrase
MKMLFLFISFSIFQLNNSNKYPDLFFQGPICNNGRNQSPIQLSDEDSSYSPDSIITSVNYNNIPNSYSFNDGRVIKIFTKNKIQNMGTLHYKKRGYLNEYELIDIEIYYSGEHILKIDNIPNKPQIEIKLIHKRVENYNPSVNNGKSFTESNNYLIVSLLYQINGNFLDKNFLTNLISNYNSSGDDNKNLDLSTYDILNNNKYFMYDGSFTYFPCDEDVSYIVVRDIFKLNESDLNIIKSRYSSIWSNGSIDRPVAKIEGRPIIRNY